MEIYFSRLLAVKRLVNIYRMLRVSVQHGELEAFLPSGVGEYQVVVLLVAVLVKQPSQAQKVSERLSTAADNDEVLDLLTAFSGT